MIDDTIKCFITLFTAIFIALFFESNKVIVYGSLMMALIYNIHLLYWDKHLRVHKL